jgi:hypothetical protein
MGHSEKVQKEVKITFVNHTIYDLRICSRPNETHSCNLKLEIETKHNACCTTPASTSMSIISLSIPTLYAKKRMIMYQSALTILNPICSIFLIYDDALVITRSPSHLGYDTSK